MAEKSAIQWTDATWNPTTGCSKVSPGCKNCYAERLALRLKRMGNPKYSNGFHFILHPTVLDVPLNWQRPKKIFVNSMSDLFHESIPNDFLKKAFDIMLGADWHIYQILTKRPERMLSFTKNYGKIPAHIWLGTSVEQALYKHRIDTLRKIPAEVKFVSFEPLIGPIGEINLERISWVIVGGESGPSHRLMKKEWVKQIRDKCEHKNVAFFFKQWGGNTPKSNGRIFEGQEWNGYPTQIAHLHTQILRSDPSNLECHPKLSR